MVGKIVCFSFQRQNLLMYPKPNTLFWLTFFPFFASCSFCSRLWTLRFRSFIAGWVVRSVRVRPRCAETAIMWSAVIKTSAPSSLLYIGKALLSDAMPLQSDRTMSWLRLSDWTLSGIDRYFHPYWFLFDNTMYFHFNYLHGCLLQRRTSISEKVPNPQPLEGSYCYRAVSGDDTD